MAQPSPKPLQPYRKVQAKAEGDLARILESTAKAIQKRIASLPMGVGGNVRGAQLRATLAAVKRMQRGMWSHGVTPVVVNGVGAAEQAAESAIETMTRVAYASLPDAVAEVLVRGLKASAESGLKSDQARRKRELSERVYRQRSLHEGKVEQLIREGLIANLSAKELAATVYQHVSPNTPGGASYAAMRLARTEINNAFHERQMQGATRPGVRAVVWNLSGSHKVPDKCNVYAAHGGNGQWPPDQIPDKPHPQCFCYLTYVTIPSKEFQDRLAAGSFDDEIERRTRENMARLGQKVGKLDPADQAVEPSGEIKSFITVRSRSKNADPGHLPIDVARRFGITEDEARSHIAWMQANQAIPAIQEGKPPPTKVRPSIEIRKTVSPVVVPEKKVTASNVVPIRADGKDLLNRVEGEGHDRVQRVLDEQRGFVPNVMRKFNGVRKMSATEAKQFEGKFGKDALGGYTVESREVAIHPQVFTKKYEREFARDLKSGFFSKCGHDHGSVESFVAHECGHHVDNIMRLASSSEVKKVWAVLAQSLGLKPPLLMDKTSLDRWVTRNQVVLAKQVSGYGSENAGELIAEIWAEYTTNDKARGHIKAVGDAIRQLSEKTAS